jgi:hypothetical protein
MLRTRKNKSKYEFNDDDYEKRASSSLLFPYEKSSYINGNAYGVNFTMLINEANSNMIGGQCPGTSVFFT